MDYDEVFGIILPVAGSYVVMIGHSSKVRDTKVFDTFKQAKKFLINIGFDAQEPTTANHRFPYYVCDYADQEERA